jgi:hypothetical protein
MGPWARRGRLVRSVPQWTGGAENVSDKWHGRLGPQTRTNVFGDPERNEPSLGHPRTGALPCFPAADDSRTNPAGGGRRFRPPRPFRPGAKRPAATAHPPRPDLAQVLNLKHFANHMGRRRLRRVPRPARATIRVRPPKKCWRCGGLKDRGAGICGSFLTLCDPLHPPNTGRTRPCGRERVTLGNLGIAARSIDAEGKCRRSADPGRLLESIGQLEQGWLAVGPPKKRDADRQTEHKSGRNRDARIPCHGGGG